MCKLILVLISIASIRANGSTILKVVNGEFPPYVSKDMKHHGLFSHIVQKIFEDTDIKLDISYMPWSRAYNKVKNGEADISYTWAKNKKRSQEVDFSAPITVNFKHFFYREDTEFHWSSFNDLKGYNIGLTKDYIYGELDKYKGVKGFKFAEISSDKQKLKMLYAKRIDITPIDIEVGYYLANQVSNLGKKYKNLSIKHHKKPVFITRFRIIINKKLNQKLKHRIKALIKKRIKEIKLSGEYDKMFWELRRGAYEKE